MLTSTIFILLGSTSLCLAAPGWHGINKHMRRSIPHQHNTGSNTPTNSGNKKYWWEGQNNPFGGSPSSGQLPKTNNYQGSQPSQNTGPTNNYNQQTNQPSHSGSQPSHSDSQSPHSGSQPSHSGSQPSYTGSQPSHSGSQPSHSGSQPSTTGHQSPPNYNENHGQPTSGEAQQPSQGTNQSPPFSAAQRLPSQNVMGTMGMCQPGYICVNYQLCNADSGTIIADGSAKIRDDQGLIPSVFLSAKFVRCGQNTFCCKIPSSPSDSGPSFNSQQSFKPTNLPNNQGLPQTSDGSPKNEHCSFGQNCAQQGQSFPQQSSPELNSGQPNKYDYVDQTGSSSIGQQFGVPQPQSNVPLGSDRKDNNNKSPTHQNGHDSPSIQQPDSVGQPLDSSPQQPSSSTNQFGSPSKPPGFPSHQSHQPEGYEPKEPQTSFDPIPKEPQPFDNNVPDGVSLSPRLPSANQLGPSIPINTGEPQQNFPHSTEPLGSPQSPPSPQSTLIQPGAPQRVDPDNTLVVPVEFELVPVDVVYDDPSVPLDSVDAKDIPDGPLPVGTAPVLPNDATRKSNRPQPENNYESNPIQVGVLEPAFNPPADPILRDPHDQFPSQESPVKDGGFGVPLPNDENNIKPHSDRRPGEGPIPGSVPFQNTVSSQDYDKPILRQPDPHSLSPENFQPSLTGNDRPSESRDQQPHNKKPDLTTGSSPHNEIDQEQDSYKHNPFLTGGIKPSSGLGGSQHPSEPLSDSIGVPLPGSPEDGKPTHGQPINFPSDSKDSTRFNNPSHQNAQSDNLGPHSGSPSNRGEDSQPSSSHSNPQFISPNNIESEKYKPESPQPAGSPFFQPNQPSFSGNEPSRNNYDGPRPSQGNPLISSPGSQGPTRPGQSNNYNQNQNPGSPSSSFTPSRGDPSYQNNGNLNQPGPAGNPQRNPNQPGPSGNPQRNSNQPSQRRPTPQSPGQGGNMGMMMGMIPTATPLGTPLQGNVCSAGVYCVLEKECNPYTGFIIMDVNQIRAVVQDQETVPKVSCSVPFKDGIQNGVCCQLPHPINGVD